jgi:methionyl-tRNA synthetase
MHTLDPEPWLRAFGADAARYFLLRHVRTGRDGDFRAERFVHAYHAELANGLGNLANRVFGLLARASASTIPAPGQDLRTGARPAHALASRASGTRRLALRANLPRCSDVLHSASLELRTPFSPDAMVTAARTPIAD